MHSNAVHHSFPNRENLTEKLADTIAVQLISGIEQNGHASLAVSGGSTPVMLFAKLSTMDLPWKQVFVTLVDERWVNPTEDDSNEKLVRTHLLQNRAAAAHFTGMKNSAVTASEGEETCERMLETVPRPFDILILGMGDDGHTASLFPGAEKLGKATDMNSGKTCIGIAPLSAPHERMTLSLPAILNTRKIILHITGEKKKEVLATAEQGGPPEELPIRFILSQTTTALHVYWAQ